MQTFKLGVLVNDTLTETSGALTHLHVYGNGNKEYIYQPGSLNPDTGAPVNKTFITEERINGGIVEELDVPLHIIGTQATDTITGFNGKIEALVYHMGRCLHVSLRPPGLGKDGGLRPAFEFDIRNVTGPEVDKLLENNEEIKKPTSPTAGLTKSVS